MLVARREGRLLDRLWEPPGVDLEPREPAAKALAARLASLGVSATLTDTGRRVRHTITHRSIEVELWQAMPRRGPSPRSSATLRWADVGKREIALTALARRAWVACGGKALVYAAPPKRSASADRAHRR
jgi:hypothetical protein